MGLALVPFPAVGARLPGQRDHSVRPTPGVRQKRSQQTVSSSTVQAFQRCYKFTILSPTHRW